MAKILCSKSGILFQCEHMPSGLQANEYHHPLFSVQQKRLLALAQDWSANKLSATESYLLYLSLLNSTGLIVWRATARYTEKTASIIAANMESLLNIVGKINVINHPSFALPQFAISFDTGTLENSFYWIQAWHASYNEFMGDQKLIAKREAMKVRVERREMSLEALIKRAFANPQILANNLAMWAMDAGDFPEFSIEHPVHKKKRVPLSDYWCEIIRACAKDEAIWRYPLSDLEELITHCEDHIPHGSIHAAKLMRLLRDGHTKHKNFTGFGDFDLAGKTTSFKLLRSSDTVEDANVLAIIQAAPDSEPKRENYPTTFAYMKAKANWDLAQRYKGE